MKFSSAAHVSVLLLAIITLHEVTCDVVPAFIWTTGRRVGALPEVFAGHTVSDLEFAEDFLPKILPLENNERKTGEALPKTLAVFLQEEMSLKDLTRKAQLFNSSMKGVVFPHLRSIMSTTRSQFLPAVSSLYQSLMTTLRDGASSNNYDDDEGSSSDSSEEDPQDKIRWSEVPGAESVELLDEDVGQKIQVYIINIPSNASPREIDEIIWKFDRNMMSLGLPYSAIYTGKESIKEPELKPEALLFDDSEDEIDMDSRSRSSRKLLQQQNPQTNYYPNEYMFINVTNCLYMYAQNITLSILGQGSWVLPLDVTPDDTSYCANYSAELSLTYIDIDANLKEVNFLMIFGVTQGLEAGYWFMPNFTVSYSLFNVTWQNETIEMYPFYITETPYGFSYSCYQLPPISPLHTMDGLGVKTVNVTFAGLQLQAFNITNNQFGYYNDCVGFFTITTWAILIVIFIMVGILMFAACMFAGLSTHDRYEDAHGKPLVINAME